VAIVVLLAFGLSLLVPRVAAQLEAWISRVAPKPRGTGSGDGFSSGLLVGASLGLVYAPCAGPILAGVITASASQSFTAGRLAVAFAYGVGSAIVLYILMLGGRRLTRPLARHSGRFQMVAGAVMVVVALLMLGDYDTRFQTAIANDLPGFLVDPSKKLEDSKSAHEQLADLRGGAHRRATSSAVSPSHLPVLGAAPDFVGNQRWFNTPADRPLSLRDLRGKVVLVDFWTYTCINCIRTLPQLERWYERYRKAGLVIVGVHTPEFPFERNASNVGNAIAQNGLRYPVVQDNDYATWDAYRNEYWPAEYFVDARGQVRFTHFGEGDYARKEQVIRALLAEAGDRPPPPGTARAEQPSPGVTTPESYLGAAKAEGFETGPLSPGTRDYVAPRKLPADQLAYDGRWRITRESATAVRHSRLELAFGARRVFLVLGGSGSLRVRLDGRPIRARLAGADVMHGAVTVRRQRLYRLVDLSRAERHRLTLDFGAGVSGYAFTFG
jgi:thiol-disulfide isomerase/thioredoxin